MTSLASSACRRLSLVTTVPIAKPKTAGGSGGSRIPSKFKLIIGGSQQMEILITKAKILRREENVIRISFAPEKAKEKTREECTDAKPSLQTEKQKPPSHFQEKNEKEALSSISHAGCDMRTATVSSTSTQKGLKNKKQGRFEQLWMVKWFDWYRYVIAMTRKAWDIIENAGNKLMSQAVRAESAKTAHSS
jgi:hypothetical protein